MKPLNEKFAEFFHKYGYVEHIEWTQYDTLDENDLPTLDVIDLTLYDQGRPCRFTKESFRDFNEVFNTIDYTEELRPLGLDVRVYITRERVETDDL